MAEIINVVVGVLVKNDKVLLTSRPKDKAYSGNWEFPGGKQEANESVMQALIRELKEEINIIVVENCKKLVTIIHEYPTATVKLDVMLIKNWFNEVSAQEGQEIYWQDFKLPCKLFPLLPTTEKILNLLTHLWVK